MAGEWLTPRPGRFIPGKNGTHCTGGVVGPRAGLDGFGKSRHPPEFFCVFSVLLSVLLCPDCLAFAFCPLLYSTHNTTSMPTGGFEPATPASNWPQTLALDRSATGIG